MSDCPIPYDEEAVREALKVYDGSSPVLQYNILPYEIRRQRHECMVAHLPEELRNKVTFPSPEEDLPMVYDLPTREWDKEPFLRDIVLSYLRRHDFVRQYCMGIDYDAFDVRDIDSPDQRKIYGDISGKRARISGAGHSMLDDTHTWQWSDHLPYYVAEHDLDLPDEFIAFVLDYYIELFRPAVEAENKTKDNGNEDEEEEIRIGVPPVLDSFAMNGFMNSGKNLFGDEYVEEKNKMHRERNEALLEFYCEMIERYDELVAMREAISQRN